MHIALFSPGWPLEQFHNGIVTYVDSSRREFERLGHTVSVFTGRIDESVSDPRVHAVHRSLWGRVVRRLARPLFSATRDLFAHGAVIAGAILEVHRREPIDVIEMEESFGWTADIARITTIPTLVKLHGPAFLSLIEDELETPLGIERIEREGLALAAAHAIAAPSSLTLKQTLERYRLAPAIGVHIVNPVTENDATPRWQLETCERDTILFVGRFDRRKGGDIVLQAYARLLQERPGLRLVFVGPDAGLLQPDGSRVHFEAFRDALFAPELRSRVDYRGHMANHDIAALRVRAMVTVVASRWENQGYTALEAMVQGCPVVASDAGGNPECVRHGVTGRLAKSEDVADFALQLGAMLDDPQAAAALGAAARQHVLQVHGAARVAAQSLALYRRVISTAASRPALR
jgi:glycosyltransferase involved in cell wall biosynthesis